MILRDTINPLNIWPMIVLMLLCCTGPAFAEGGKDHSGHPRIDAVKGKQEARAAAVFTTYSSIVVTGFQNQNGDLNDDVHTVKYNASGNVVWRATYNASGGSDRGAATVIDRNGDAIVAATVTTGGVSGVYVARYHDNGTTTPTTVWSNTWTSGITGAADIATAIAYNASTDRVYVAGYSHNTGGNDDYLLLAYDNSVTTGNLLSGWPKTFDSGSGRNDRAFAMGVNTDGSRIVLTGESSNGSDLDLVTVVWDSGGNQLRNWRKSGAESYNDRGTALAFTPSGNIIVTGYLTNSRGGYVYTAELAPDSDNVVWEALYDDGSSDIPAGVAVDSNGDVYIAVTGLLSSIKIAVIKYHKNGTTVPDTLWASRFDAGSFYASGATGITVDTTGVYVTGWRDYSGVKKVMILKFGSNSGHLLWQKEWSGVAGKNSSPIGIGLGGQSVVVAAWSDQTQPADGATSAGVAATGYLASPPTLQHAGKTWGSGNWSGYYVYIVSSANILNNGEFRRIQGNDATSLTLATAFPGPLAAGDLYYIYDKDNIDYVVLRQEKGALDPPTALTAQAVTSTSIQLTFQDNTTTEDSFKVYWKKGSNGNWCDDAVNGCSTAAWTINSNGAQSGQVTCAAAPTKAGTGDVTCTISGLVTDKDYYIKIAPYQGATLGDFSTEANALTRVFLTYYPEALKYTGGAGSFDNQATAMITYPTSGNAVVTGTSHVGDNYDLYTLKLNRSDFSIAWQDRQDGGYEEYNDTPAAMAVTPDPSKKIYIAATSVQNTDNGPINSLWTLLYPPAPSSDGEEAVPSWSAQHNGLGLLDDHADAIAVGPNNSAVVAGHGNRTYTDINLYLNKLNDSGEKIWANGVEYDSGANEYPAAVAMDTAGNVFVAGRVENSVNSNVNILVAKFNAADGTLAWADNVPATGDNQALDIVIDAQGDPYVAGYTTDAGTGYKVMTVIKYVSLNGNRSWTRTNPSTPSGDSKASKIAYDAQANQIVVAGDLFTGNNQHDLAVLRYNIDGELQWGPRTVNRPATDEHLGWLGIDPSGYIYVTGTTGTTPNTDLIAAIFTPSGGAGKAFLYADPGNDGATCGATTGNGEFYACGYRTAALNGKKEFLVLKYLNDLPARPDAFTATPLADSTKMKLDWTNITTAATLRITRPDNTTVDLPAGTVTYTDTNNLAANTPYCWSIKAVYNTVETYYNKACATTTLAQPAAPTASSPTSWSFHVAWTNIGGNTGYRLERKTGSGGTYAVIAANLPQNQTYFDDINSSYINTPSAYVTPGQTYYYRVTVNSASGWSVASVDSAPAYTVPVSPTGWQSGGSTTTSSVNLPNVSWPWTGSVSSYRIERKPGPSSSDWQTITPYVDSASITPNTTYTYRAFAIYQGVENSTPGPEISFTTPFGPPTLLSASPLSNSSFTASWTRVSGNAGYDLVGVKCWGSVYNTLNLSNTWCSGAYGSDAKSIAQNVETGTLTGADTSNIFTAWKVVVRAKNPNPSVDSNSIIIFKPLSVTMSNVEIPASNQLKVSWTNTPAEKFDVERRTTDATWPKDSNPTGTGIWVVKYTMTNDRSNSTPNWTDATVFNNVEYCYRVRAYSDSAAGGPAAVYTPTEFCRTALSPPSKPVMTLTPTGRNGMVFTWTNTNKDGNGNPLPTRYNLVWQTHGYGDPMRTNPPQAYWGTVGSVSYPTLPECSTATCTYTVNSFGRSADVRGFANFDFYGTTISSDVPSNQNGYEQVMPSPPTIYTLSGTTSSIMVTQSTNDVSFGYTIAYKKATDTVWLTPNTGNLTPSTYPLPYNTSSWTISGLEVGTQYQVQVQTVGKTVSSDDGAINTVWTLVVAPGLPTVSNIQATGATVAWSPVTGATSYKLERSSDNVSWGVVTPALYNPAPINGSLSYSESSLSSGTIYWYRVKAVNSGGDSAPSTIVQLTTKPAQPVLTSPLTVVSDSQIDLSWPLVKGATQYKLERRVSPGGTWQTVLPFLALKGAETESWSKIAPVSIINFKANFPTRVTVTKAATMNSDFSDIRFYDWTAKAELPYWIETDVSSNPTVVTAWVKPGASNTINLLYGNSSATSNSNGRAVFEFFDDFSTLDASVPTINGNDPTPHIWSKAINKRAIIKGTAAATGNSATALQDDGGSTGTTWTANYYTGNYLLIMSVADKARSANIGQFRRILTNSTGRVVNTDPVYPFPAAIGTGDTYQIIYDPTDSLNLAATSLTGGVLKVSTGAIFSNAPVISSSPIGHIFEMKNKWDDSTSYNGGLTVSNAQFATSSNGNDYSEQFFAHDEVRITSSGLIAVGADGTVKSWNLGAPALTPTHTFSNIVNTDRIVGLAYQGANDIYCYTLDPSSYATQYSTTLHSANNVWSPVNPCTSATAPYLFIGHQWGENAGLGGMTPESVDWVRVRPSSYPALEPLGTVGVENYDLAKTYSEGYCGNPNPTLGCASPLAANTTTYSDTGLNAATIYDYRLTASNSIAPNSVVYTGGDSAVSAVVSGTTSSMVVPALTATPVGQSAITLDWSYTCSNPGNCTNPNGYEIEKRLASGEFARVAVVTGATTYTVTGLQPNTPYMFRVRGYKGYIDTFTNGIDSMVWGERGNTRQNANVQADDIIIPPSALRVNIQSQYGNTIINAYGGLVEFVVSSPGNQGTSGKNSSRLFADINVNPSSPLFALTSGDFNMQVDYNIISFDKVPDAIVTDYHRMAVLQTNFADTSTVLVDRRMDNNNSRHYYAEWTNNITTPAQTSGNTLDSNDKNGKLRFERIGSTINTYFSSGGGWNLLSTNTGFTTGPATYIMFADYIAIENKLKSRVQFDNFELTINKSGYSNPAAATTFSYTPGPLKLTCP